MRILFLFTTLLGVANVALAHTLVENHDALVVPGHQLSALHHLPGMTLLLALVAIVAIRRLQRQRR